MVEGEKKNKCSLMEDITVKKERGHRKDKEYYLKGGKFRDRDLCIAERERENN